MVFIICLTPCHTDFRFKLKKNKAYVFCPNHTSYLDIPTICFSLSGFYAFMGKDSLAKVPLFGYMFQKLYIPINRRSKVNAYKSYLKACKAIDNKRSLVIFPEGTIPDEGSPRMIKFKDGAFKIAIEKQVPIVPVTIPHNWEILPDLKKMHVNLLHRMRVIYHEPIETTGMTLENIKELKEKTYQVIHEELKKYNKQLA
ncbi:lysophospholipid acyltransferase family protein [Cytophagaceae bacterium ABcell3]|nr:lysophospholipid acyltransferase family protein [Cytophagaceae bacterium ABcell3]